MTEKQESLRLIATKGPHSPSFFSFDSLPCTIGRGAGNSVRLTKDGLVSGSHCEIPRSAVGYSIKDLGSTNGTYVNGNRIHAPVEILPKRSTIHVGKTQLLFVAEGKIDDRETIETLAMENIVSKGSILLPSSNFFRNQKKEEALLVVDLCNSTAIASKHGEDLLLKILYVMGKIVVRHAEQHDVQFLKCTGDGFFGTFDGTEQALRVACGLLEGARHLHRKVPQFSSSSLRIAIHRGQVTIDEKGERLGLACHLVFRLEGAKLENTSRARKSLSGVSEGTQVFLTNEAVHSLDKNIQDCFLPIGKFIFKGFKQPVSVNALASDTSVLLEKMG